jgi:hypothetical protein
MVGGGREPPSLAGPLDHVELATATPRPLIFRCGNAQAPASVKAKAAKQRLKSIKIHLSVNLSVTAGRR